MNKAKVNTAPLLGPCPENTLANNTSCFDPEPVPSHEYGVIDSTVQLEEPCNMLSRSNIRLGQDYLIRFRNRRHKTRNIKHFTIFPVENMTLTEFDQIIHKEEICCLLLPCLKAACEEYSTIDDGCEESDLDKITDFGVRALYLFAKHVFPRLNVHDQIIVNGLLTLIAHNQYQSFDNLLLENCAFFYSIYRILRVQIDLPPTLTNYAGIALGKIEDFLVENKLPLDEYETDDAASDLFDPENSKG